MMKNSISTKGMNREKWLELRRRGIGGSDGAAILGLNDYKTPVDVYLDKVGRANSDLSNDLLWFGREVEPVIAKRFEQDSGLKVRNDYKIRLHPDHDFILGNMDRLIEANEAYGNEGTGVLEIKTTNQYRAKNFNQWGVADSWFIQLQHYMMVTGYTYGYIGWLVDRNYQHKRFEADKELHQLMIAKYDEFWNKYVKEKTPPPPSSGDDVLKLFPDHREGKMIEADATIVDACKDLAEVKGRIKELKKDKKQIEDRLKTEIADAEGLQHDGKPLITWKTSVSNRFNTKQFKSDHPDMYQNYCKESSTRRFLLK